MIYGTHTKNTIGTYNSLAEVFNILNTSGLQYIVLRNFEDLSHTTISSNDDIDFLCTNRKTFVKVLSAKLRGKKVNKAHYEIIINEKKVKIDVREIGDGYYCTNWEREFLRTKQLHDNMFYIMDKENYFYSLIYHCIIHKGIISEHYLKKINTLRGTQTSPEELKKLLFSFLIKNNYTVTNSSDWELNVHYNDVSPQLIHNRKIWTLKRCLFQNMKKAFHK